MEEEEWDEEEGESVPSSCRRSAVLWPLVSSHRSIALRVAVCCLIMSVFSVRIKRVNDYKLQVFLALQRKQLSVKYLYDAPNFAKCKIWP